MVQLTMVDKAFSTLVVRLSMIKVNSSSVISSCIAGPRNKGGLERLTIIALLEDPELARGVAGWEGCIGEGSIAEGEVSDSSLRQTEINCRT